MSLSAGCEVGSKVGHRAEVCPAKPDERAHRVSSVVRGGERTAPYCPVQP